jgi:alanine dehydrogenase
MRIGVPSEIKSDEYRVAITPAGVRELSSRGHDVLVQAGAGEGSAMGDDEFRAQGAQIVPDAEAVFAQAELVLKVKEPQPGEVAMLRAGQTLFTYLHLAAEPELARGLQESGATCIAYETVEDDAGRLPLLAPMSEVAGKIATQAGAFMLEKPLGGRGILLGGVPGVAAATVLVHGGRAPHVVTREQLKVMRRHAVLVDVSIDQGGCFETSRPTTHSHPTYEVDGITHYCVTNMPGAVPITSTFALTNATLPYVLELAQLGVDGALSANGALAKGLNVRAGEITHPAVAAALGEPSRHV